MYDLVSRLTGKLLSNDVYLLLVGSLAVTPD